jgi:hypothetical protein
MVLFQKCVWRFDPAIKKFSNMLKSSSLCLYSSNLGTFGLKIEQFWPFEEISIFSNGGHLGYSSDAANISHKQKGTEIFTDLFTTFDFINVNQRSFA